MAWLYVYGEWPRGDVDHKDNIKHHNWIGNLRPATETENNGNVPLTVRNTSGYKGVHFDRQRQMWRAMIGFQRRLRHIGFYKTPEEAHRAYYRKAKELFGEFAHPG